MRFSLDIDLSTLFIIYLTHLLSHSFHFLTLKLVEYLCTPPKKSMASIDETYSLTHLPQKKLHEDKEKDESEQEQGEDDSNSCTDVHNNNTEETARIPEITTEELQTAINKLKKGKSPDSKGIRAEDIKACDDETRDMVRQIFNKIIRRNEFTPEEWKKVTIKVMR